jgi:hypothetical protein
LLDPVNFPGGQVAADRREQGAGHYTGSGVDGQSAFGVLQGYIGRAGSLEDPVGDVPGGFSLLVVAGGEGEKGALPDELLGVGDQRQAFG